MKDPEIKPLPWYRAPTPTPTSGGRKYRRHLVVALLVLCAPCLVLWLLPRVPGRTGQTLARFWLGLWPEPEPPAWHKPTAAEIEESYREEGCEQVNRGTWICPNPDAGMSVADCREVYKLAGWDLDAGDDWGELKCGRPAKWKEQHNAVQ